MFRKLKKGKVKFDKVVNYIPFFQLRLKVEVMILKLPLNNKYTIFLTIVLY